MPWDVSLFNKKMCIFLFYEEIWEADEQHKWKKIIIKVDSQITIAQTIELSSFKRQNINAQILSVSNLYSIQYVDRTVPVLYYFRKVSFRPLGKETFKLVKTFIISVQDSLRCYFVLCTPWLAQGETSMDWSWSCSSWGCGVFGRDGLRSHLLLLPCDNSLL